ncbi:MAG: ZinT/AdcA family metal-binding protein [Christensenellales bacterium]|jgi:zinc transport system substrate-binding protein|nr:metal-binding protein ZinT [Christensenellaceae bacterium]
MKKLTKLFAVALALLIVAVNGFNAVAKAEDVAVSLMDWDGTWLNMVSFYSHEDLKEVVEHLAQEHEMSVDEFIEHEKEKSVPFEQMVVDGENSTISFVVETGEDASKAYVYEYVKSHEFEHGGSKVYWHEFKTEEETENAVILLIEIHGEEKMAHFHLRAGKDADSLLAREDWYPTFVGENMPTTMIAEELEHHHHSHDEH